jgi:hypothetical protein
MTGMSEEVNTGFGPQSPNELTDAAAQCLFHAFGAFAQERLTCAVSGLAGATIWRAAAAGHRRDRGAGVRLQEPSRHRPLTRHHIRRFTVTHAARHDGSQLAALLDQTNAASGVWTDTAYRSQANLRLLDRHRLLAQFQRAKPRGRPMPAHIARGNATRAQVRARVEHVFAAEKRRMELVVRTVGQPRGTAPA